MSGAECYPVSSVFGPPVAPSRFFLFTITTTPSPRRLQTALIRRQMKKEQPKAKAETMKINGL